MRDFEGQNSSVLVMGVERPVLPWRREKAHRLHGDNPGDSFADLLGRYATCTRSARDRFRSEPASSAVCSNIGLFLSLGRLALWRVQEGNTSGADSRCR